ncbi:uncharacterized protein LOC129746730 [Uranotaenia lowii]|uniref:uncharacterized protein LOC129746730 n=1 Tax=Uranotaenia lowii TaxID=190385 RepID=UPI0024792D92|nr:uncharacterized protein LOC129746730 [Uranotaenia lowii]
MALSGSTKCAVVNEKKSLGPVLLDMGDIFMIEQCLLPLPLPDEFFLRPEPVEESISKVTTESEISIALPPLLTKWEDLYQEGLSPEIIAKICFTEMLLISANGDENVIGGLALQVDNIADEVFAVFCSSGLALGDDRLAGYELLALTDKNFQPMQERQSEALSEDYMKQEKQMQLFFGEDMKITAFREVSTPENHESCEGTLELDVEEGLLVPDGLNMLLMRYLVVTNYSGDFRVRTINIQGQIGHCVYQVSEPIVTKIGEAIHCTKEIIRSITYPDQDEPEISVSYYLLTGQLLRHTWNNSNHSIIMNPNRPIPDVSLNQDNLCAAMEQYLMELAEFLQEHPGDARRWSTLLPKPSAVVQAVLSELLLEVTKAAATPSPSSSVSTSACSVASSAGDTVRRVLIEIVEQMSLGE